MVLTLESVKSVLAKKKYRFFDKRPYDLNIIGVRASVSVSNSFDDWMTVSYFDEHHVWYFRLFPCTTDPGKPWLLKPMVKGGTAILVPGQYSAAYTDGFHSRSSGHPYRALEQIQAMTYVRDNNRDSIIDQSLTLDKSLHFRANLKTNIHRATPGIISKIVGPYSAGCQVLKSATDFDVLMDLVSLQQKHGGPNLFTYTLLVEADF
jgi:hypothetical protein